MYQKGDYVVYGMHGVCIVKDLEEQIVDKKRVTYLVIEPLGQDGARYLLPTHNTAAMSKLRHMLSRKTLQQLLEKKQTYSEGWIVDENRRKQLYRELINTADPCKTLQMLRTLYAHRQKQLSAGKRCHICDENFLRDAEKQLVCEMSVVLEMTLEDAKQYLKTKLKEDA